MTRQHVQTNMLKESKLIILANESEIIGLANNSEMNSTQTIMPESGWDPSRVLTQPWTLKMSSAAVGVGSKQQRSHRKCHQVPSKVQRR